jgi:hypothetical protein
VEKILLKDKYPVMKDEWLKKDLKDDVTVDDILNYLLWWLSESGVKIFGIFDHLKRTKEKNPNGYIYPGIKEAKMLIFCGWDEITSPYVFGVKPRNIWVVELDDRFVISFLEIPNEKTMEKFKNFFKELKNKLSK